MLEDKTLTCMDCGQEFVFTAGEQEFYEEKGFTNEPKRCKKCRDDRKGTKSSREMFETTCAECGKQALVPFQPKDDRPVYCSECFAKHKSAQEGSNGFGVDYTEQNIAKEGSTGFGVDYAEQNIAPEVSNGLNVNYAE